MNGKVKIAVFASGSGRIFKRLKKRYFAEILMRKLSLVVTDRPEAYVVERAKTAGSTICSITPKRLSIRKKTYERRNCKKVYIKSGVEWIVLAGYMRLVGSVILSALSVEDC